MVLQTCKVSFSNVNDSHVFFSGDTIQGTISLILHKQEKLTDLTYHISCVTKCRWRRSGFGDGSLGGTLYTNKNEEYSSNPVSLLGNIERGDGHIILDPGPHEFPFSFIIPPNLPTSMEGKYGRIRYTFHVTAYQTKYFSVDKHFKKPFTVVTRCDLNNIGTLNDPVVRKIHKDFSSLFTNKGIMVMTITLPMTGFVPGQDINIQCNIKNVSQVKIMNVSFRFYQVTNYKAASPQKALKKEEVILKEYTGQGANKGDEIKYPVSMTVPALAPSTACKCAISTQYFLKVKASVSGSHGNPSTIIPLTIGNVPVYKSLQKDAKSGNHHKSHNKSKSILSAESRPMDDEAPPPYHNLILPSYEESQATFRMLEADPEDQDEDLFYTPTYPVFHFPSPYKYNNEI